MNYKNLFLITITAVFFGACASQPKSFQNRKVAQDETDHTQIGNSSVTTASNEVFILGCSDEMIEEFGKLNERTRKAFENGVTGEMQSLETEKFYYEAQLCKAEDLDLPVLANLMANTVKRQTLINKQFEAGIASQKQVFRIQAETNGLKSICPALKKRIKAEFDQGIGSKADLEAITKACAGL